MRRQAATVLGAGLLAIISLLLATAAAGEAAPFAIQVVDESTGRGVPLVELRTVADVVYVTDSAGLAAVREPTLVGQNVYFHVRSHGYEHAADGFGFRGRAVRVTPGGSATLQVRRINVAERLYRVTGTDIYRDSVLLGRPAAIAHPLVKRASGRQRQRELDCLSRPSVLVLG